MAIFPKIQSPCPYLAQLSSIMDGDFCRMCQRQVFDLTAFSDAERRAFLAGCGEEVCVSYRLRPALAAAALAAAAVLPAPALAQDAAPAATDAAVAAADISDQVIWVTGGGIKDPANVEFIEIAEDEALPELPVAYEDGSAAPSSDPGPVSPPAGS